MSKNTKNIRFAWFSLWVFVVFLTVNFVITLQVEAASQVAQIEADIEAKNTERIELEAKAKELQEELSKLGSKRSTLASELTGIAQERKELENQIALTQNSINTIELEIDRSTALIENYSRRIQSNTSLLERNIRAIYQTDTMTALEVFLTGENFSKFFGDYDTFQNLKGPLLDASSTLQQDRQAIYEAQITLAGKQEALSGEQAVLGDQRALVAQEEAQKGKVLSQTKNQESEYQKNLTATLATIDALDKEIESYESTLKFLLDKTKLPEKGSEILSWPLSSILITQRFGKTVSSEQLYVSGSHSGVDFRASVGTPVYAVADGVIKGVGDTDVTCPGASFGKWVFIEHTGIGLSTTYGHLSSIKVTEGQKVKRGDIIAYSGNTGHSTAPHLHLTVYATEGVNGEEGVRVTDRPSTACVGATYRMPLAPTAAYLDPLAYLPATTSTMFKYGS